MSFSQEQIRNLFNLKKEEKILDDFGCSLSETIPIPGRLYLTENYICFGSNLFGFNRKYSIAFNEIIELRLKKSSIEIELKKNKKNKFYFSSFTDIQMVYRRIKSMCRSYNETLSTNIQKKGKEETAQIILSDSEDSDEEDVIVTDKTSSSSKKNSIELNTSNDSSSKNQDNKFKANPNQNLLNISNNNININTDLSKSQVIKDSNLIENLNKEENNSISNNSLDEIKQKNSSPIKSKNNENEKNKNQNNPPNKKNNEINSNSNIIEDEEIKFNPIEEGVDAEICRKIININPKDFFEKYQTNAYPETSYKKFYEWEGNYSEIGFQEWEKVENPDNPEIEKFKRIETFCLALHGVPLINKSNVIKTLYYWVDKDGTYYIKTSSKSSGVPLSDCFLVETNLEFHPYMNNTKTVFRTYVRTTMLKSTIFKSALISQGKKSYAEEINKWLQFIEEKGEKIEGDYVYKPKKRNISFGDKHRPLCHGIEKEISRMKIDKHIVDFSDFCEDIYNGVKKYSRLVYEYFNREFDRNTRAILICFFIIFILLLFIIHEQSKEIKELKKGFNEIKKVVDELTKITLELKKRKDK